MSIVKQKISTSAVFCSLNLMDSWIKKFFSPKYQNMIRADIFLWILFISKQILCRFSLIKASFILSNPFYIGLFKYGGEIHEGKHEPIISKKLFDEAQEMLRQRGQPERKPQNEPQPYCGLIFCASCGMMITAENKTKRQKNGNVHHYVYYRCMKKSKVMKCPEMSLRSEQLDKQLSSFI